MGVIKNKNFVYLKGPKGDKGDKGDPGSGVANGSGRIVYNSMTKTIGFNEEGLATTNFVTTSINNLINNAPAVLDTLNELADAIDNNPNFVTTINSSINSKLSLTGGTLTGPLTLASNPSNNLEAATKQYVDAATSSITIYSTDDVPEGENNLYFTQSKARSSISVTGDLSYNSSTGVISLTIPAGFSGSYDDLTNKPTIPTNINSLSDVDTISTTPNIGDILSWNGTNWVPTPSATSVIEDASLNGGEY